MANYVSDPAFRERLDVPPEENEGTALMEFIDIFGDPSLTWDDLASLRTETDLPCSSRAYSIRTTPNGPSNAVPMA